jgi:hypothetical protein
MKKQREGVMLPNPVQPTSPTPAAGDRPQLKIAARSEPDPRSGQRATSEAIEDELSRWNGQWRRTLETVKSTLADLEQACESAIETREADVAGLVDRLVEKAAAEASAAAEQTRAQAQVEIDQLQGELTELRAAVVTLRSDLDAERENVKSAKAQLETDVAGRVRAEAERDEARAECQRQTAAAALEANSLRSESNALRAELSTARQQLDAAIAERAKLATTVQVIQQALAQGPAVNVSGLDAKPGAIPAPATDRRPDEPRTESSVTAEVPSSTSSSPADAPATLPEKHPEVAEDIKRVLEQVKDIYELDLNSGRSGTELVDSLTGSLRYARNLIVARWHRDDCDAETLFESQLAVVLDANAGISFGRHLSIAVYELRKPAASPEQDEHQ